MSSNNSAQEIWAASTTRSFYNSPEYAEFMGSQGNRVGYLDIGDLAHPGLLPYARPTVWTHWRRTRFPVPPVLAPSHSIYSGVLLTQASSEFPFGRILDRVRGARWSTFLPGLSFVQPALLESGPADFLDAFNSAIAESGYSSDETQTRVIAMPTDPIDATLKAGHLVTDQDRQDSANAVNLLASYSKKRRYDIRRAQQLGVRVDVVRIESAQQATEVYSSILQLHRESWARTGLGPHTLDYWCRYSHAMRESGGHDLVARAYTEEGALASVVNVHVRGRSAYYQMNSSSIEGQKLSANPVTLHAAIAASNVWGARYFELGRYSLDESSKARSVYAYKEEYGGDLLPVPNFRAGANPRRRPR